MSIICEHETTEIEVNFDTNILLTRKTEYDEEWYEVKLSTPDGIIDLDYCYTDGIWGCKEWIEFDSDYIVFLSKDYCISNVNIKNIFDIKSRKMLEFDRDHFISILKNVRDTRFSNLERTRK